MSRSGTRGRGLTLVEVIVTLAIVAALVAILLPAALAAREQARAVGCAANLRALAGLLQAYAADQGAGLYPPNINSPAPGKLWYDRGRVGAYARDTFVLPSGLFGGGAMACPSDEGGQRSYAMNVWASSATDPWRLADPARGRLWRGGARAPERVILLAEAWSSAGSDRVGYFAPAVVGYYGTSAGARFGGAGGVPPFPAGRFDMPNCELPYQRHRRRGDPGRGTEPYGRVNLAYMDGHVALKSNGDLVDDQTGRATGDSLWSPLDAAAPAAAAPR